MSKPVIFEIFMLSLLAIVGVCVIVGAIYIFLEISSVTKICNIYNLNYSEQPKGIEKGWTRCTYISCEDHICSDKYEMVKK